MDAISQGDVVTPTKKLLHLETNIGGGGGDCDIPSSDPNPKVSPIGLRPPSPIITRRDRRLSLSERAARNPVEFGVVKYFCRQRGHGYVTPNEGGDDIFLHISDIEGEFVPCQGDVVSFRKCPLPPKFEKQQAVHVSIRNLSPAVHERWNEPPHPHPHPHPCPNTPEYRYPAAFHFPSAESAARAAEIGQHKEEDED